MINEMLLQRHNGVIGVFPVFPRDQKASFYRLRTFGAFLFTGAIENGNIQRVLIESEKGRVCTLRNPWPGQTVGVLRDGKAAESMADDLLVLKTRVGEKIELKPSEK